MLVCLVGFVRGKGHVRESEDQRRCGYCGGLGKGHVIGGVRRGSLLFSIILMTGESGQAKWKKPYLPTT